MSNSRKEIVFDITIQDKETKLKVVRPNLKQQQEGKMVYNEAFAKAVKSGAILRARLDDFIVEQGLWDDDKQERLNKMMSSISDKEQRLREGGFKLNDARQLALDLRRERIEMRNLIAEKMDYNNHTAEGQAEDAQFNYWVSTCLVYNDTGKPVFSSLEEYLENSNQAHASTGAAKLAELMYNLAPNFEDSLEENKFLKEFGFVDEKGRLVNKDGDLVDLEGRKIDEDGYLLNDEGARVDIHGNLLDDEGKVITKRSPFLDDDGNPIE